MVRSSMLTRLMVWFVVCGPIIVHSQPGAEYFVGSTPCDSLIRSVLGIPEATVCEFIKWKVEFLKASNQNGTFKLTALYGESLPNTNGFKAGGLKSEVSGTYIITRGAEINARANVYQLTGTKLKRPLVLVRMDDNLFHFADDHKNLVPGNGGFGNVLNKSVNH
jgi:hypothetical protein